MFTALGYSPTFSKQLGNAMAGVVSRPVSSVTAPAPAQEDSASRKRSEAVLHAGEHIKHVSEGWKEDGIGVLMFVSSLQLLRVCVLPN
jgi:hypothetical protein